LPLAYAQTPAEIYQQKCASCHGAEGGGVEGLHDGPLYGDESLDELTRRISETMPEDDPEACMGDEARAVAAYIHGEFYSRAARIRSGAIAVPRIELTRLTVPQHRNAIADLIGAFTPPVGAIEATVGGLQAEYFESKNMSKTEIRKTQRVDPRVDFDFGPHAPLEGIDPTQFAIIWKGSFATRDTGRYEFRIRTPNGVRLYVNTDAARRTDKLRDDSSQSVQSRLIDAWVGSKEMRTVTGKVFLLGGRQYPLRLEFFKFQDPSASVRLEWKPPHGTWAVMDENVCSPMPAPRTFVLETPFPADDRSLGYERGSSISREWQSATTSAALETAEEVLGRLPLLSGVGPKAKTRASRLGEFAARFASRAYRRPLSPEEEQLFRTTLFENRPPDVAVRRAVLLALSSPHFLYTNLSTADVSHRRAERLALALWDSLPDEVLRDAADDGALATSEQVTVQAERMIDGPRTRNKLQGFFRHWLELEERDLAKDQSLYPEFDNAVIADLRRSLEIFVDRIVWSDTSDYRQLLLADYLMLNPRLRRLYDQPSETAKENESDVDVENGGDPADFKHVDLESESRAGILTHPYLLSAFAYHDNTSPIHRGVFLTRNIIGRALKPPPVAVSFENNQFAPDLTMREKVTELTRDKACQSCHEVINPLGFALENYDAVGRWRATDAGKQIDTHGDYTSPEGTTHRITSARDIAHFAAGSPTAQRAFITQVFQHLVKQSPSAFGDSTIENLRREFVADDFHIQRLLIRIATLATMHDQPKLASQETFP